MSFERENSIETVNMFPKPDEGTELIESQISQSFTKTKPSGEGNKVCPRSDELQTQPQGSMSCDVHKDDVHNVPFVIQLIAMAIENAGNDDKRCTCFETFKERIKDLDPLSLNNSNKSTILMVATYHACLEHNTKEKKKGEVSSEDLSKAEKKANRSKEILRIILDELKRKGSIEREINQVNEVGNSAAMIAAELGCKDIFEFLFHNSADITLQQERYKHTALILACERDHEKVVEYIITEKPDLINEKNKYDKCALVVAAEFGSLAVVKKMLELRDKDPTMYELIDVNAASRERTALMYSCQNTQAHFKILKLLIEKGANKNNGPKPKKKTEKKVETNPITNMEEVIEVEKIIDFTSRPLTWAATHGSKDAISELLIHEDVKECINDLSGKDSPEGPLTALMVACAAGHYEVAKTLISHGASLWKVHPLMGEDSTNPDVKDDNIHRIQRTAFYMALKNGHACVTELFMEATSTNDQNFYDEEESIEYALHYTDPTEILSSKMLDDLSKIYYHQEHLSQLLQVAVKCDFHFNLFVALFQRFESLNSVLNVGLSNYLRDLRDYRQSENDNVKKRNTDFDLVYKFTQILSEFERAKDTHPLEKLEIKEYYELVNKMIDNIFECREMSSIEHVDNTLCFMTDTDPILAKFFTSKVLRSNRVRKAYAFRRGPIALSLNTGTQALFSSGQISLHVDDIFWNYLRNERQEEDSTGKIRDFFINNLVSIFKSFNNYNSSDHQTLKTFLKTRLNHFYYLRSDLIHARYNPSMMFFAEGLSKLAVLALVIGIIYKMRKDYAPIDLAFWKRLLALFTLTHFIHEYGELCSGGTKENHRFIPYLGQFRYYFDNLWNYFDVVSYLCLIIWSINYVSIQENAMFDYIAECALCISGIFLSCGILRYVTVVEDLGKLTILLKEMTGDLVWFAFMFVIVLSGFAVTLFGLLNGQKFCAWDIRSDDPECSEDPYFGTPLDTFLTMFSATLGNFDLEIFKNRGPFRWQSIFVLVLFLIIFSIVVLSLIVARMSATHDKINENAFQAWQFSKARFTEDFLLIEERNPMCMLPPPLNLVMVFLLPFHISKIWEMEKKLDTGTGTPPFTVKSLGGTFSDKFLGILASFFAPFVELIKMYRSEYEYIFSWKLSYDTKFFKDLMKLVFFTVVFPFIIFPALYPLFVVSLIMQSWRLYTEIDIVEGPGDNPCEQEKEYLIHYDRERRFEEIQVEDKKAHLEIKVIRGNNLQIRKTNHQTVKFVVLSDSNPRLNKSVTLRSLVKGDIDTDTDMVKDCFFVDAILRVPLESLISIAPGDYLDDIQYKLKLYDENGEEYASRILTREIRKLMANLRFEGNWKLHRRRTNVNGNSPEVQVLKKIYEDYWNGNNPKDIELKTKYASKEDYEVYFGENSPKALEELERDFEEVKNRCPRSQKIIEVEEYYEKEIDKYVRTYAEDVKIDPLHPAFPEDAPSVQVAARVINMDGMSDQHKLLLWKKVKQSGDKCKHCRMEMKTNVHIKHGMVDSVTDECSENCQKKISRDSPELEKGGTPDKLGYKFIGNQDTKVFPNLKEPVGKGDISSQSREFCELGDMHGVDDAEPRSTYTKGTKGAIDDRQSELLMMRYILRPKNVIYNYTGKMTFNNHDLSKIFDPMKKKFADKKGDDITIDWKKKYYDLKKKLEELSE